MLEVGYDGRIIDVSVSALTVGATYLLKDGKFKWGFNYGWIGVSVSVDFIEIGKIVIGGE